MEKYVNKIYSLIKSKSKNWWNQLSTKNKIVVIYKNDRAEWESNKLHKELKDSKIKFILWLKHKDIGLDDFVRYVLNKVTIKHIEALVLRDNPLEYILENNNIFLKKNKLHTKKDYIPRYSSRTKMNEKKIYEKLKKSTVLKNKMKEQGWFSFLF